MQNVVVTGFGPFRDHQSNPSWEAIRDGRLRIDRPNINLVTRQIKVSYQEVDETIAQLWAQFEPILMVHVGLAAHEDTIRIEQVARHGPYLHDDVAGHAPHSELRRFYERNMQREGDNQATKSIEPPFQTKFDCSRSRFDVEQICERLNESRRDNNATLSFKCSQDAGLYVCEYIYQTSLRICDRTVFIHVPDTKKFQLDEISCALQRAIEAILDGLNEVQ